MHSAPNLETLDTPCLVLDRTRLGRNLERMAKWVGERGVKLRPHMKTAKCVEVARLAAPAFDAPIAVSTLHEAEYFFTAGYRDIFYCVGLGPGKVARAAELTRRGARLVTMVDSVTAAGAVASAVREGARLSVVIEVDCGEHRGGVSLDSPALLSIARTLGPAYSGIATHGGQSYAARTPAETAAVAKAEAGAARQASARLSEAGFPSRIVSIGSSPTAVADEDLTGITEIRAGVYMFWDLFQAGIGACELGDLALSVLTEVIGRPEGRDEFLIDAGAFALSKDLSTAALPLERRADYGWVCDLDGTLLPDLRVARVWQEHGLVVSARPLAPDSFPVGTRVRILPNHACPTASAHPRYQVIDGARTVTAVWSRTSGW